MHTTDALPCIDIDAAAADESALLLDVREYAEWMAGHAPRATHIEMNTLPDRLSELDRTRRIICVCRSGNRSARVTAWLLQQGFDAVNMTGGMSAWASRGLPFVNHAGNPGVVI
jgi:rhodanese-related sulfurtransferase